MSYESDHTDEPGAQQENTSNAPAPQESFGPDFPQEPQEPDLSYASPEFYRNIPPPQPPYYGAPQPPPPAQPYGYAVTPQMPPPYGYGPPNNGYGMPPARPLTFWQAVGQLPRRYWYVFTHPNASTFVQELEQGKASWGIVWTQLLALAVFTTLINVLLINLLLLPIFMSLFQTALQQQSGSTSFDPAQFLQVLRTAFQIAAFAPIVTVPLFFFVGVGLNYLIARLFGGRGTFLAYAYCFSLFNIPITFISYLLSFIPLLGYFVPLAGWIYQIILQVHMTMGVHRLSGARATWASLILPIIGIVLSIALIIGYVALILSVMQQVH